MGVTDGVALFALIVFLLQLQSSLQFAGHGTQSRVLMMKMVINKPTDNLLCESIESLTAIMGGSGRAKIVWENLREGVDPQHSNCSGLSEKAKAILCNRLNDQQPLIANEILQESLADCGTRKLLLRLQDGLEIETVLIPAHKYDRTTLCVSTQVGCDRGCAFCLTGTMGIIRNLTATEIIGQVVRGLEVSRRHQMPPMTNVVFMGMGDAGRNLDAVQTAVECLVDRHRFSFAQSKVTVSTVGPSPAVFSQLAQMPATLAWSLHSPCDRIRRLLVPSTRHTTVELRDALLAALVTHRPNANKRTLMLAFTLLADINDRDEDAHAIADFVTPMLTICPKIALDLIPYNDNHLDPMLRRPQRDRVNAFQEILRQRGFFCSVRVTRGDEESAACGMLATKKRPAKRTSMQAGAMDNGVEMDRTLLTAVDGVVVTSAGLKDA